MLAYGTVTGVRSHTSSLTQQESVPNNMINKSIDLTEMGLNVNLGPYRFEDRSDGARSANRVIVVCLVHTMVLHSVWCIQQSEIIEKIKTH